MRKILIGAVLALCFAVVSITLVGKTLPPRAADHSAPQPKEALPDESLLLAAPVTVTRVAHADFVETVLATGSLVAREEILVGQPWNPSTIDEAVTALAGDFTPLSDARASAAYRALAAGNMLRKVFIESAQPEVATRVPEAAHG